MTTFCFFRKKKDISQSELSLKMGVSQQLVSKWETGKSVPRPAMLIKLADIFGVTVDELLREGVKQDADRQ